MSNITVIGAGMSGLLAACMLRSDCLRVIENQLSLPNNHSAVLRYRSSVVGDTLGIAFKKVKVLKTSQPWKNPMADAMAYAYKCTGQHTLRSSLTAKAELEERFIAPSNLIQLMADRVQAPIELGLHWKPNPDPAHTQNFISTLPMPVLMKLLGWKDIPEFKYVHGANINIDLSGVDAYGTVYVPDPNIAFNRVSLTGSRMTIEFASVDVDRIKLDLQFYCEQALALLGMNADYMNIQDAVVKSQQYAKILPINDDLRKKFISWASEQHNIYSLGRFSTWRVNLLQDDVVNDVRIIQKLIQTGHSYDHKI